MGLKGRRTRILIRAYLEAPVASGIAQSSGGAPETNSREAGALCRCTLVGPRRFHGNPSQANTGVADSRSGIVARVSLPSGRAPFAEGVPTPEIAEYVLRLRQVASTYFQKGVLAGSAWEALLALHSLSSNRRPVHLGRVAKRAGLKRTTAVRTLKDLARSGLVSLSPDPSDNRATIVTLTARGRSAMESAFVAARFSTST
jgi:DNA-binding MarR family transcriptional regulator